MAILKKSNQFSNDEVARQLRTNIEYMQIDKKFQVINITSTTKNEGKSTIICELARIYAAKYSKVLLIDGDLRNPSVHSNLNISNGKGLTNILSELTYEEDVTNIKDIKKIKLPNMENELSVVTAGSKVPNPAEVLESKKFKLFIEKARKYYNYILIDCPPVGYVADAIPVSNISDGTLFVVSCEENHKKAVRDCVFDLQRNGVNIIGTVLNNVDITSQKYGYGYYYGYGEDGEKKRGRK